MTVDQKKLNAIFHSIQTGHTVPYLGCDVLQGVTSAVDGSQMPCDSDSLILAMNGGQPMAPRLMYEFPRAAMNLENKKGRSFIDKFLTRTYAETQWHANGFHQWLKDLAPHYVIDTNRDLFLQTLYADRPHTLIVGISRIAAHPFRFDIYEWRDGVYAEIQQEDINPLLPILFKPLGSPAPKPSYIASDADFVDYITELMGGFAIPGWLKEYRTGKQYAFFGMRFTRDTERMVMSDVIYGASEQAGWAFIPEPTEKEQRFCAGKNIEIIEIDWQTALQEAGTAVVS